MTTHISTTPYPARLSRGYPTPHYSKSAYTIPTAPIRTIWPTIPILCCPLWPRNLFAGPQDFTSRTLTYHIT